MKKTILLILISLTFIAICNKNFGEETFFLDPSKNISSTPKVSDFGKNYYTELAKSFAVGKTYLLGPYHPDLKKEHNPFSSEALQKGHNYWRCIVL